MADDKWRGVFKVIEECGELTTVLGKLGPFPSGEHPDGAGPLKERIEMELADVQAACVYFAHVNGLNIDRIESRMRAKVARFQNWVLTGLAEAQP